LVSFVAFVSVVAPVPARAQSPDAAGVRAQGLGGAFTAVADDSSATWWNPAGLATGAYLNAIVEYGRARERDGDSTDPARRPDHRGFSLAFPALGLSYYRLTVSEIRPSASTAAVPAGRQDPGTLDVRAAEISQFGASAGQSLGGHVAVASTLKLVRGLGDTQGSLDIGGMAVFGVARLGVMVRNAREVTLGDDRDPLRLRRQVRAGAAVTTLGRSSWGGATVAIDADLRTVPTATGDERRIAVGGELWTQRRSIGARAGFSGSTVGDRRSAVSGGVSLALKPGIFADGALTGGSDVSRRGWAAALRVTF